MIIRVLCHKKCKIKIQITSRKTNKTRLTSISNVVSASSKWDSGLLYEINQIANIVNLRSIMFHFICNQPWIKLWTYLNDESLQCGSILMAGLRVFVGNSGKFWKLCTQLLEYGIWVDNIWIKKNWKTVLLRVPENIRKWLIY